MGITSQKTSRISNSHEANYYEASSFFSNNYGLVGDEEIYFCNDSNSSITCELEEYVYPVGAYFTAKVIFETDDAIISEDNDGEGF